MSLTDETTQRNYYSLKAEFFDGKKASKGLAILKKLQEENDNNAIGELLDTHLKRGYYGEELKQRFYVDDLLSYYNLLFIGILSGFIPQKLDEEITKEILSILDHPAVFEYYNMHYPYKLCNYTRIFLKNEQDFSQEPNLNTARIFNEFISITRTAKIDQDIVIFLGMLDFVSYGDTKIVDVIDTFKSFEKLNKVFTSKNDDYLEQAVWGFIKYASFITQLRELLDETSGYPLLQSAMWCYHEYNFGQLNTKMKPFFDEAFTNLEGTMNDKQLFIEIIEDLYGNEIPDEIDENELMKQTLDAIKKSRQDVDYVLDMERWNVQLFLVMRAKKIVRKNKIRRLFKSSKLPNTKVKRYKFKASKVGRASKNRPRKPRNNEL